MTWCVRVIGFLCTTLGLASALDAQAVPHQVRFFIATSDVDHQWQGYLERLTPDSLYLRVPGSDTIAAFPRSVVRSVERERRVSRGRAAGMGCVAVGAALSAVIFESVTHSHNADDRAYTPIAGTIGLGVGCAAGAVGGLIVSAVRSHGWEPWILPGSIPSPEPPNERCS